MEALELELIGLLQEIASKLEVIELMKSQAEMTVNIAQLLTLVEKKLKELE